MGMTHTLSGNVLSFQTAEESNITSLKCNFSCNLNYHEFNGAWPGGAGKNKLGFKTASGVADGTSRIIDFTENYIKVTAAREVNGNAIIGYPTAGDYCRNSTIPAGTYTFSVQDFSSNIPDFSKSNIRFITTSGQIFDGETFTFTEDAEFMFIGYSTTFSWPEGAYIMFKLLLEEGSSVTSWEPYENIAIMTGYNQIEVQHYGNNICNLDELEWYDGYRNDNGVYTTSANSHMILTPINVKPLTIYYLKIASSHTNTRIYYLTKDEQWINRGYGTSGTDVIHFITPENCYKILMQFYNSDDVSLIELQEGRQISKYEAYHENKYFVNFPAVGKNLLDEQTYGIPYDTSMCFGRTSHTYADNMFLKAGTYTVSSDLTADMIVVTNSAGRLLNGVAMNTTYHTFTLTEDGNVGILFYKTSMTANEFLSYHYLIEVGDTATSYEPFNNTIYGGYVDLVTGELVQTHAKFIEDGSTNSNTWSYINTSFGAYYEKPLAYLGELQPKLGYLTCMFNYLKSPLTGQSWEGAIGVNANASTGNPALNILRLIFPKNEFSSVNNLLSYLTDNPLEVIYKLETPIIYQLTPQQLQTYIESNYFYSDDADTIECTYEFNESVDILATRKKIIASIPHIETASGNIASFNTDLIASFKSVKVNFLPTLLCDDVQSPTNIGTFVENTNITLFSSSSYISLDPINFESVENGPVTPYYLGGNKFYFEGTADTTRIFNFSITPFTLYKNLPRYVTIVSDTESKTFSSKKIGLVLKNSSTGKTLVTTVITLNEVSHQTNTVTLEWPDDNEVADILAIALYPGLKNVTVLFVFSYSPINDTSISLGRTLYGGYVDLITGNVYNQYNKVIIDGSQSITEYYTSETYGIKTFSITKANLYPNNSPAGNVQIYCDSLSKDADATSTITSETKLWDYWINAMSYRFTFTAPYSYTPTTIAQYLSEHPIILVYRCADTLVATLNPIELKALKGLNNIWTNANSNIEVKYWTH